MTRLISSILVICLVATIEGYAQRVFFTSQDLNRPASATVLKHVRPNLAVSRNITVVYQDGRKTRVPRNAIWGFEDRQKRVYRLYKNDFFEVVERGDLIRYVRSTRATDGQPTIYTYFSKTLDSDIHWKIRKAKKDVPRI